LLVGGLVVAKANLERQVRSRREGRREEGIDVSVDAMNEVLGGQWRDLGVDLDQEVCE